MVYYLRQNDYFGREREREKRAEKEPIMLCRIADRGLLLGYLGNKTLSLYEDWREDSLFLSLSIFLSLLFSLQRTKCILYLCLFISKEQMISMKKENKWNFSFYLCLLQLFSFVPFFEFLLALSVHSKA